MRCILVFLLFILGVACQKPSEEIVSPFSAENPWPEIRKKRIQTLLPKAMQVAQVDAWIILCRENNNDPIADHIGGENAGGTAAFLFYLDDENEFHSIVFSPEGEAKALDELNVHDEVIFVKRGTSSISLATDFLIEQSVKRIAVNISETNSLADGLSYSQYKQLEDAFENVDVKLESSEELIYEWLSIKLPEEVEIMTLAAEYTAKWQIEAYNTVIPGKTTDADIARFLKDKMAAFGVTDAWAPDQNPSVNSGVDRGHSHATDKVIMPGDVIQTDFGIRVYDRWVTDIQRFAYVLKEGESQVPDDIQGYWEAAKAGSRAAFGAMKPGTKGVEVDLAQRKVMKERGSEYVMWSTGHPVGYVAHDIGPNLGGSQISHVRPNPNKPLKAGMTFAYDGFFAWTLAEGGTKTISVEEMTVITENGAEFLIPPQEELVLIPLNK